MSAAASSAQRICIGIIANNDRTASDLLSYLATVGIDAHRRTDLCASSDEECASPLQALVIFPDDFEVEVMASLLDRLAQKEPALLQIIVTRQPQRFLIHPNAQPTAPPRQVMPRPTFGWRIVDAIRAHLEG